MDSSQGQFADLSQKISVINGSLDQLKLRLEEAIEEIHALGQLSAASESLVTSAPFLGAHRHTMHSHSSELQHKDVLVDSDYADGEFSRHDGEMAPEMQIRRLTAQLTAAYNRIAALEEQLLSQRMPVQSLEAVERIG
jgi:hypothetical protein